ncbi:ras oncogene family protein, putative [Ichthyophthirius multifiliis]|uniref:Ras oncogene family protein, putative n=1 Tax=Ichthyophthirius multifiliis TaxID=5932 RepID=G0QZC5_ICHMU|nr:ras oncogene family protein, putative [Ichthyophthirius multifiliis]EGR29428.1 ras oncogene family protein, putative [Ichthyophthirius multifiliis]|eukprot:XP_004030664.1 ras oncogene family protein, putative [Ichthyophthirius multifiliis]
MSIQQQENTYQFKILLIGDSGVGKTCLMTRYADDRFNIDMKSTIGVEYSKKIVKVDNSTINLQIWDTAGQERFRAMAPHYYKGALGILIVTDVTKRESLENVEKVWLKEINNNASKQIKKILIGNKSDLNDQRAQSQNEAIEIAKQNDMAYLETSALDSSNVNEAFQLLVKEILSNIDDFPEELRPRNLTIRREQSFIKQINIQVDNNTQKKSLQTQNQVQNKKQGCC